MKRISFLIILFVCYSCHGPDIERHVKGKYSLVAIDASYQLSLTFQDSPFDHTYAIIIPYTVFAVGYNEKYIIAKQHFENIKNIINYYVVPIKSEYTDTTKVRLIGPLSLEEFEQKKKELNLENVNFSIVYKNLE